jgi:hypothetical protein
MILRYPGHADRSAGSDGIRRGSMLVLAGTLLLAGHSLSAPSLLFEPAFLDFGCGETARVDIMINDEVTDLLGFSLVIAFDPAVLQPLTASVGDFVDQAPCGHFFQWLNPQAVGDSIAIDGAMLGCTLSGPGDLIHLVFEGTGGGSALLSCRYGELRDHENKFIRFLSGTTTVQYTCPTPITRTRWGAIKTLYRY